MSDKIQLSTDLHLPVDALVDSFALLARKGAGKTYGAKKLAEGMLDVGGQIVVLDPVGKWYALRLNETGDGPSRFHLPVFGGLHGDIPLEPTAGALLADVIVDHNTSAVLDVSMFESEAQKCRFVADFANRLLFRKKSQAAPTPIHLFVEEAQEFAPQRVESGDARMVGAMQRIVKLGRNFGIGITLISQRPQAVNKEVLNLTGCLIVLQTTGPQERKTLEGWITQKDDDGGDVKSLLSKVGHLQRGEAFVWAPQGFPPEYKAIFKQIKIGKISTFDSSKTPRLGDVAVNARALAPIDLGALSKAMAATIEKTKSEDVGELQTRLKNALASMSAKDKQIENLTRNIDVMKEQADNTANDCRNNYDACLGSLDKHQLRYLSRGDGWYELPQLIDVMGQEIRKQVPVQSLSTEVEAHVNRVLAPLRERGLLPPDEVAKHIYPNNHPSVPRTPEYQVVSESLRRGEEVHRQFEKDVKGKYIEPGVYKHSIKHPPIEGLVGGDLLAGERAMLAALAAEKNRTRFTLSRAALGVRSGFNHKGGGFRNYISKLKGANLIALDGSDVILTVVGVQTFGPPGSQMPTPKTAQQLTDLWCEKMTGKAKDILRLLVELGPESPGLLRHEIAININMDGAGGGFRNYLSSLMSPGLIIKNGKKLKASPAFFGPA